MWDYITKIAECAVALAGLILSFISVRLSRLSFREAKLAREDIAKFGFRQKQEMAVAKLVKYLNGQNIGFYLSWKEVFVGNIWEISKTTRLDEYKDYEIDRFIGNFSIMDVDEFIFNVYIPKEIALILRKFKLQCSAHKPHYGDKIISIRTSFHFVDEEDYNLEAVQDDHFFLNDEISTVSKFTRVANLLKNAVEQWYRDNGILDTCNILPIDSTGIGPSVIGMFREGENR